MLLFLTTGTRVVNFTAATTKPGYVMLYTPLSIPGYFPRTKGHGLKRMVRFEVVLVQPGASLQNRWHRDRAAKSCQHPRHMDLNRLWSCTKWDPSVHVGSGRWKTHVFSGNTMVWEQWGEKRGSLIDPGTMYHPPELQPGDASSQEQSEWERSVVILH